MLWMTSRSIRPLIFPVKFTHQAQLFPFDFAIRRAVANSKKNSLKSVARFNDKGFKGSSFTAVSPSGVDP
jgi:hypothetical protein